MDDQNTAPRCAECEGGAGLKTCNACKEVKYCSVGCQRRHWPRHKKECKQHAANLHDKSLLNQPPRKEKYLICYLPIPFAYGDVSTFLPCCGKIICDGCCQSFWNSGNHKCPFCKTEVPTENKVIIDSVMKRVDANDVYALKYLGSKYATGSRGLRQDCNKALELWARAAELGSSEAHNATSDASLQGWGVEIDRKKATHHFELAAIAGHEKARYSLGWIEFESDRVDRAIKHRIISASSGHRGSMPDIQRAFERGLIQKHVFEQTLKAYDVSCAEMRSKARDGAARFR